MGFSLLPFYFTFNHFQRLTASDWHLLETRFREPSNSDNFYNCCYQSIGGVSILKTINIMRIDTMGHPYDKDYILLFVTRMKIKMSKFNFLMIKHFVDLKNTPEFIKIKFTQKYIKLFPLNFHNLRKTS